MPFSRLNSLSIRATLAFVLAFLLFAGFAAFTALRLSEDIGHQTLVLSDNQGGYQAFTPPGSVLPEQGRRKTKFLFKSLQAAEIPDLAQLKALKLGSTVETATAAIKGQFPNFPFLLFEGDKLIKINGASQQFLDTVTPTRSGRNFHFTIQSKDQSKAGMTLQIIADPIQVQLEKDPGGNSKILDFLIVPDIFDRIALHASIARQETEKIQAWRLFLWSFTGLAFVTLGVGLFLIQRATHPFNMIADEIVKADHSGSPKPIPRPKLFEAAQIAEAFNHLTARLGQSEAERKQMLQDTAHELRTPLTAMTGRVEAMQKGLISPDDKALSDLLEDINSLTHLVEDLRLLADLRTGSTKLVFHNVNLSHLTRQVWNGYLSGFQEKGHLVHMRAAPDLVIRADPQRLRQVLHNLIKNAYLYTPKGHSIDLMVARQEGQIILIVENSISTMPDDRIDAMVKRHLHQRETEQKDSQQSAGSGLGLYIARQLMEAMGGTFKIHIEDHSTVRATLSFPIETAAA